MSCPTGKKSYANRKQANWALLQCWKKGREEREAYQCRRCGAWHLTSAGTRRARVADPGDFEVADARA